MAVEIRWDDKVVKVGGEKGSQASQQWVWTRLSSGRFRVSVGGKNHRISVIEGPGPSGNMVVRVDGVERQLQVLDERAMLLDRTGMSGRDTKADLELCAPMPGKVLSVLVKPGQKVEEGDSILILEAMKMENAIKSSITAVVEEVLANAGSAVEKGELLVKFAV
jgi:biotin carboxyl carrier protein